MPCIQMDSLRCNAMDAFARPGLEQASVSLPMDQAKDDVLYNASEREKSTSFVCSRYSQPPTSIHRIHPMFFITTVSVLVADDTSSIHRT